ncbi:aconitate hydratase [Victivallaceae bacterium BBE-744-WT-12]|uniref:Aconitate hydratase A n=1 Tax=Victivallis lenta TaxID=2606640 RepID=A0A844G229_9BACT|nr:aconitate hydratase [Victivallis lenta]AVM44979.1 aconitate hydratase [Victivallales bacterium CCUG 44730]MST97770.1 aconitate hydratase [Victivallis lenta]HBP07491.1 aconitate hydratase [Lentisphaeria bacterium]HCH84248.1 aconitate hydratase [Lentisphaeria bacterium]
MARGTVVQKIIEAHFVEGSRETGKPVAIRIDQTLTQDATGTMAYLELEAMNVPGVKTELSVSYVDHNMMQNGPENRNDHLYLQSVAAAKGVRFSPPGNGICHQVHLERFGVPGKTLIGSDSHTPTGGGIGMMAIGAGGLDVALAMAGKPFRIPYPKVIGVKLTGKLSPWCAAKDVILKLLSILTTKGNVGSVVEYFGPGVATLTVPQRATITNMGAELGVTTSLFPSDESTRVFLKAQDREKDFVPLAADPDAEYDQVIEIRLDEIEPLAACPSSPDNIKSVRELAGTKVGQVLIGSCTNSSYRDLAMVAMTLKGRRVSESVTLSIAPGSRQVLEMLARNGMLADIIASGARILETGCGPCIGQGQSPADDTVSVRTFNRNFAGRTGTKGDQAYLVSPETAVAIALTGEFTDPRTAGIEYPNVVEPEVFEINDNMIQLPGGSGEIVRKRTIGAPPVNQPLPDELDGVVVIKVGDKITTDHIMPAGIHLKHRSNIPVYAKVVFECFNEAGRPTFAERASAVRDSGKAGIIVGRDSYGQGSSREHAAICPMYLGVKVVAALAIERIHSANLVNFGIVPLVFANPADYDSIGENDSLVFHSLRGQLRPGEPVRGELTKADGTKKEIVFNHRLSAEDIRIILAGGMLNL